MATYSSNTTVKINGSANYTVTPTNVGSGNSITLFTVPNNQEYDGTLYVKQISSGFNDIFNLQVLTLEIAGLRMDLNCNGLFADFGNNQSYANVKTYAFPFIMPIKMGPGTTFSYYISNPVGNYPGVRFSFHAVVRANTP